MEYVNKILEQKAVRITAMRQLLLEFFVEENKAFGLGELEKAFPKSDRITMYRTLKTFEENGILHSIKGEGDEAKYALCNEHCSPVHHIDQHPHFQCQKCKQVTCIDSLLIPAMELPNEYIQEEVSMMIKGICPDCQT
ncbi:MAG: transcriptional repressor [Saprospiraceae bacterium]|nr:transcriptional repressor [Saprospiraceae bacterium]